MTRSYQDRQTADRAAKQGDPVSLSIRSRPTDVIPVDLLEALIDTGVWSAGQALSHAEALAGPWDRGEALERIAAHLAPAQDVPSRERTSLVGE